jgi:hypothetical protein
MRAMYAVRVKDTDIRRTPCGVVSTVPVCWRISLFAPEDCKATTSTLMRQLSVSKHYT